MVARKLWSTNEFYIQENGQDIVLRGECGEKAWESFNKLIPSAMFAFTILNIKQQVATRN